MKKIKLFDDIEKYLDDLEELLPEEDEFLESKSGQYTISMLMLNLITSCIDIGSEIVTIKQLGYPESYRDIFTLLGKSKIISPELVKKMHALVGLRNLLAHEYGVVSMEKLYENAADVSCIEEFVKKTFPLF